MGWVDMETLRKGEGIQKVKMEQKSGEKSRCLQTRAREGDIIVQLVHGAYKVK